MWIISTSFVLWNYIHLWVVFSFLRVKRWDYLHISIVYTTWMKWFLHPFLSLSVAKGRICHRYMTKNGVNKTFMHSFILTLSLLNQGLFKHTSFYFNDDFDLSAIYLHIGKIRLNQVTDCAWSDIQSKSCHLKRILSLSEVGKPKNTFVDLASNGRFWY